MPKDTTYLNYVNMDNEEHRARIYMIIKELKRGKLGDDIAEQFAKEWDISKITIKQHYLASARKFIKQTVSEMLDTIREEQTVRYMDLYNQSYERGNLKQCTLILSQIDKIYGLEKQMVETKSDITIQFGGNVDDEDNE